MLFPPQNCLVMVASYISRVYYRSKDWYIRDIRTTLCNEKLHIKAKHLGFWLHVMKMTLQEIFNWDETLEFVFFKERQLGKEEGSVSLKEANTDGEIWRWLIW